MAKKGLEGIVFDKSSISNVKPAEKSLYYRGYPVQELAENCSYEETAYLLMHGELPTTGELESFEQKERASRELSPSLLEVIERFPRKGHPMDAIRTVVSYLGMEPEFAGDETAETALAKGLSYWQRSRPRSQPFKGFGMENRPSLPETICRLPPTSSTCVSVRFLILRSSRLLTVR